MMSAQRVISIPHKGWVWSSLPCSSWGPEEKPENLTCSSEEYQKVREIFHAYKMKGMCAAAAISLVVAMIIVIVTLATGDPKGPWRHLWGLGIPWPICIGIAMSTALVKINAEILHPKGMHLQNRCLSHEIVIYANGNTPGAVGLGRMAE
eukprot:TRINITY_DN62803_c0_g1_i1.p1 TRINITY_DN62803_c0_g1~~TRINITY_DN62803_c0_g1_i1.p1  ORF type:complete len:171 (+),score=18.08 TRINITY_DN62803_c0_g1_i1:65-514(+)